MSFELLAGRAIEVGFQMVGVSAAVRPATFDAFKRWVDSGMFAGMLYLAKNCKARENPNSILNDVKSIIMLGVSFQRVLTDSPPNISKNINKIKGVVDYARGVDYHFWIREKFESVLSLHRELYPSERCRGVVDSAPLLERQYAVNAGLGQIGKNTMLITKQHGSNVFLGAILSTATLHPAKPVFEINPEVANIAETNTKNFRNENSPKQKYSDQNCSDQNRIYENLFSDEPCKDCSYCLDVCPTGALVAPYILDARYCLNYWTIESRGEVPELIRAKIGGRFFGCDTCRAVCPCNSPVTQPEAEIDPNQLDKYELLEFAKGTPLERRLTEF
jgi:epoxyqueuosine reductase